MVDVIAWVRSMDDLTAGSAPAAPLLPRSGRPSKNPSPNRATVANEEQIVTDRPAVVGRVRGEIVNAQGGSARSSARHANADYHGSLKHL